MTNREILLTLAVVCLVLVALAFVPSSAWETQQDSYCSAHPNNSSYCETENN